MAHAYPKRRWPKLYSTILRMEQRLFHNAYNLFVDSCLLYRNKSFPTALALSVLAYEELGKMHILDHIGFEARLSDPKSRDIRLKELFCNGMLYNHKIKQEWALVETPKELPKRYKSGLLDKLKQDAFYVGFVNGRIVTPDRISEYSAYNQIRRVMLLLLSTDDLAFYGVFDKSSPRTKRYARSYIKLAVNAFRCLKKP